MDTTAYRTGERRPLIRSVLLLAASVAMVGTTLTAALFTDSASSTDNTFADGTLDMTSNPTTAFVTYSNMAPGDSVTDDVTLTNSGSLSLRYSLRSTTSGSATLAAQLDLTVWNEAEEGDSGTTCAAVAPATRLYGPADLGSASGVAVFGDPAQGEQAGDRWGSPGGSEVLCFRVHLPLSTDNTYQGESTTATFDFHAEQTRNNP